MHSDDAERAYYAREAERDRNGGVYALVRVARAWSHEDDWGMDVIAADTLADLAAAIMAGDDPVRLAEHAEHVNADCARLACESVLPAFYAYEAADIRDMDGSAR